MSENTTDITNDNIQDNNENNSLLTGGSLYESSTDKYKDNLSSASHSLYVEESESFL
ncbi:hypothetical protein [Eubacterium sp. AM46-8]|uniref:hypothetical protein n=1 Tax=Eubacterium sp. AM46-8 TaxID=2292350 RepID=UPI001314FB46|nr:hypothetical protein [Eubacterium sp. AM46-8]